MKFSTKDFLNKFDRIWSQLLKKSLVENFIFCAVYPFDRLDVRLRLSKTHLLLEAATGGVL